MSIIQANQPLTGNLFFFVLKEMKKNLLGNLSKREQGRRLIISAGLLDRQIQQSTCKESGVRGQVNI